MFFSTKTQQGYSIVEVLVAVAVLMIALVGPLTIAATGLKNARNAQLQNTAFFLAQEAIETVVAVREGGAIVSFRNNTIDDWAPMLALPTCTAADPCGVDVQNRSFFRCSSATCDIYEAASGAIRYNHTTSGTKTNFTRRVYLNTTAGASSITSVVTWGPSIDERVTLRTILYNIYDFSN